MPTQTRSSTTGRSTSRTSTGTGSGSTNPLFQDAVFSNGSEMLDWLDKVAEVEHKISDALMQAAANVYVAIRKSKGGGNVASKAALATRARRQLTRMAATHDTAARTAARLAAEMRGKSVGVANKARSGGQMNMDA